MVNRIQDCNVRLFRGSREHLQIIWPDMFNMTSSTQDGFAVFSTDGNSNIDSGRIWVSKGEIGLFTHELGHILGLGHASDNLCEGPQRTKLSMMCVSAPNIFDSFDQNIIKTLYNPKIPVGKNFEQIKPIVEELLKSGIIQL